MLHWWTSGGEAAALERAQGAISAKEGYAWKDVPVAGGGGDAAMTALKAMVAAGNHPTAVADARLHRARLCRSRRDGRPHRRSPRTKAGTRRFRRRCRSSRSTTASGSRLRSTSTRSTGCGSTRR